MSAVGSFFQTIIGRIQGTDGGSDSGDEDPAARQQFNSMDSDHNGVITRDEWMRAFGAGAPGNGITSRSAPRPMQHSQGMDQQQLLMQQQQQQMLLQQQAAQLQYMSQQQQMQQQQQQQQQQQAPQEQMLIIDKHVPGEVRIVERPVYIHRKVKKQRPADGEGGGEGGPGGQGRGGGAGGRGGGRQEAVFHRPTKMKNPPGDGMMSAQGYLNQQAEQSGKNRNGQSGGAGGGRGYPYHDPAFGCHFRSPDNSKDAWDYELRVATPDVLPPLELLLRDYRKQQEEFEKQKRLRRRLTHMGDKAQGALAAHHPAYDPYHYGQQGDHAWEDDYPESHGPLPFRRKHQTHHPGLVCIDPHSTCEEMGGISSLAWWLA